MAETFTITNAEQRRRVADYILQLEFARPVTVTVERDEKARTTGQNAALWALLDQIVKHVHDYTGQEKDEIAEIMKRKFLTPKRFNAPDGEILTVYSTRSLSQDEFRQYIEKVRAFAIAEFGLILPTEKDVR